MPGERAGYQVAAETCLAREVESEQQVLGLDTTSKLLPSLCYLEDSQVQSVQQQICPKGLQGLRLGQNQVRHRISYACSSLCSIIALSNEVISQVTLQNSLRWVSMPRERIRAARAVSMVRLWSRPLLDASCMFVRERQVLRRWDKHLWSAQHFCSSKKKGGEGGAVQ